MSQEDGLWFAPGAGTYFRLPAGHSLPRGTGLVRNAAGNDASADLVALETYRIDEVVAQAQIESHMQSLEGAADAALRGLFPGGGESVDEAPLPDDPEAVRQAIADWLVDPERMAATLTKLAETIAQLAGGMAMVTDHADAPATARIAKLRDLGEGLGDLADEFRKGVDRHEPGPWKRVIEGLEALLPNLAMERALAQHRAGLLRRTRAALKPLDGMADALFGPRNRGG